MLSLSARSTLVVCGLIGLFSMVTGCHDESVDDQVIKTDDPRDLKILSIQPAQGPLSGGTLVVMTGEGFTKDLVVTFAGAEGSQLFVGGDSLLALKTPGGATPGPVEIVATRKDGQTATVREGFTYLANPSEVLVLELTPPAAPMSETPEVFVIGKGFVEGARVLFGEVSATNVRVLSAEVIQVVAPAGDAQGVVPVRVELPDGSAHTLDNGFTYLADQPTGKLGLLGVLPPEGPLAGGNVITLEGRAFVEGALVYVGGNPATEVRILGPTALTARAPRGNGPGLVDVRVEIPSDGGLAATSAMLDLAYRYLPEDLSDFAVLSVTPADGPLAGGNIVAVGGTGFIPGAKVFVGGSAATEVTVLGPQALTARTPAGNGPGLVDVRVQLPAPPGESAPTAFLEAAYRYLAPSPSPLRVLSVIPAEGPLAGGSIAAIRGTGFLDGARVFLGGQPCSDVQVLGPEGLTCRVPPATVAGPVDIRVELPELEGQAQASATLPAGYRYLPGPPGLLVLRAIPNLGPTAGGNLVTLVGTGFSSGARVFFGGAPASQVEVLGATSLSCVAPASLTAGPVDIRVELPALAGASVGEAASLESAYVYQLGGTTGATLGAASLYPSQGEPAGGALVLLTGTGFDPAMVVRFGTIQSPLVQVLSSNAATAIVPGTQTSGFVDVTLTNPDGTSVSLPLAFRYLDANVLESDLPPALGGVLPSRGPALGGTLTRVFGANFSPALRVWFGNTAATELTVVNPGLAYVRVPAGVAGPVPVRIANPDDQDASLANAFTYTAAPSAPPTVSAIWPNMGPSTGGTWVVVTGTGFAEGTTVWFGLTPATRTTRVSSTRLIAVAPAGRVGSVAISAVGAEGENARLDGAYAWYDPNILPSNPPVVGGVSPSVGDVQGGAAAKVLGSGFQAGARVFFGAAEATVTSSASSAERGVLTPSHPAGAVSVTVVNPDGLTHERANTFVFFTPPPLVQTVSPSLGGIRGGYEVTVRGKNFTAQSVVTFGPTTVTSFLAATPDRLTFFAPPGVPGAVTVSVTNPDGQFDLESGAFLYIDDTVADRPTVASIEPELGPRNGGYIALIRGLGFSQSARVEFGGLSATGIEWLSPELLKVVVPPGVANTTVDITVINTLSATDTLAQAFTYQAQAVAPLRLASVKPGVGSTGGGTVITLDGDGFTDGSLVFVGGIQSPTVNVVSQTTITAVTPPGTAGLTSVRVERPDLTAATAFNAFAYIAPANLANAPRVITVAPAVGPLTGGSLVLITGAGFSGTPRVFFGANEGTQVTRIDATLLTVRTPARADAATVAVSVVNPDGLAGVLPGAYSFYDASRATRPEVFIAQPGQGPTLGNAAVNLVGAAYQAGARAYFCGRPATVTGLTGNNQLAVLTPAQVPGVCTATVVNPDGLTGDRAEAYEFVAPTPSVASAIPSAGPRDGGIEIVIRGAGFVEGASVRFGLAVSPSVTVSDQNTLTARLPANNVGVVDITVINPGAAQAQGVLPNAFTYVEDLSGIAPTLTNLFPISGPLTGGTPVRVIGTGFDTNALVIFDGALIATRTVESATEIRFTTPPRAAPGPVAVTILNPDGLGATAAQGFTYAPPSLPAPIINSVVPATGPEAGGNTITITGQNFRATGTWTLDGRPITTAATITESLVTLQAPPRTPGRVDLAYIGPDGQVALRVQAYQYLPAPVLSRVVPALGPVGGDTEVTLIGDHFAPGMQFLVNGIPGQVLLVSSASTATARTPPSIVSGLVDVSLRNPDGQQRTLANGFEYLSPPTLTSVWPPTGPNGGGTLVQITGNGFHPQSRVFFGTNESATVRYRDRNTLLAFTPEATVTLVGVRVVNPDNQQVTLANAYTYVVANSLGPAPALSDIFPARGPSTGGTRVSLDGANLAANGRAFVLPAPATIDFVRANRAIIVAPAGPVGPTPVYWVNPDGQTVRAPVDFTYLEPAALGAPPQVTSFAPETGPTAGNTAVSIAGVNFQQNARVRFGADDAIGVTFGPNALSVRTPAHPRGPVSVWVVNPDGTQAQAPTTYRFLAPPSISNLSPVRGPSSGGTTVTINGQDLLEDPLGENPQVAFCDDFAASAGCVAANPNDVTVSADGRRITVRTPARAPGLVDVAVVAPDGQRAVALDAFTVTQLPTLGALNPNSGPSAGGQTLSVTGTGFQTGIEVFIRGVRCTAVNVLNATSLTCVTPAGTTGPAEVRLVNSDGGLVTVPDAYTYLAPPVLNTIVPNLAPEGTQVETALQGINFSLAARVFFNATEVPSADIISRTSTLIRLRVPLLSGSVDVIVRNPDGQESRKIDGFSYIPPLPPPSALFALPRTGLIYGGESFRVAGAQFLDGVTVEFGKAPNWVAAPPASIQVRNNGTLITGLTPQHPAGTVDVRITNSDGQSDILTDAFEFVRPPDEAPLSVINLEPARSVMGGGGWLSISGTGFRVNVQVTFLKGQTAVPSPEVQRFGPTLMRARIPPSPNGTPGRATVIVTNPATFELPQEVIQVADFFEYITGPVYERHPGDRLQNERTGDNGALIFDANGDGLEDVLIFNSTADYLKINGFQGRVGWFSERNFVASSFGTRSAYAYDFNDDGNLDIVRFNGSQLQYCANQGGGNFSTCTNIYSGCSGNSFEVGDLNCDGRTDFFMPCNSTGQDNAIVLNMGGGRFSTWSQPLPTDREQTRGAALADVDNDGDTDIILAQGGGANTRLYLNNCADLQLGGQCQMRMPNSVTNTSNGKTYSQSNFTANWDDAQAYCKTFGYDGLVRVDTATEHDYIRNATGFTGNNFWIGLNDPTQTKNYVWTQPGATQHAGWCSGQPAAAATSACAYFQWSTTPSSQCWVATTCTSGFRFTCESAKPQCASAWSFANAVSGVTFPFSAGDGRDVKFVDINGDDRPDVVIAFYGQATRVYMNTGGATQGGALFQDSFVRWPVEANQDFDELIPVDIDNDGDTDIVTRRTNAELRLYMNDRYVVSYKKFNCDPAVANCTCNPCAGDTCERVENNGVGSFSNQTAQRWPDGNGTVWRTDVSSNWRPFAVGDLDDDDLPDFYVTGQSRSDRMILNCGHESGSPWVDTSRVPIGVFRYNTFRALPETGTQSRSAALADFNGDGHPDIARCGASGMGVTIWLNDGAGKWNDATSTAMRQHTVQCNQNSLKAVDLDGDGDLDIHIEGTNSIRAQFINNGFASFTDRAALNITAGVNQGSEWTLFGDFDRDGDSDWLVGWTAFGGGVRMFVNGGNAFGVGGAFGIERTAQWITDPMQSSEYQNTRAAVIININNDQYPDIYLGVSGVNRAWRNVDGQYFVPAQSSAIPPGPFTNQASTGTNWLLAADFDNDGDTDIVDLISGRNRYHLRSGTLGYFDVTNDTMPDVTGDSRAGDVGDIDLDGLPDIYIANGQQDQLFLSTGNGFTDASAGLPWMISHDTYRAFLYDFDNDCDLDVLVINSGDQDRIYLNTLNPPCD